MKSEGVGNEKGDCLPASACCIRFTAGIPEANTICEVDQGITAASLTEYPRAAVTILCSDFP